MDPVTLRSPSGLKLTTYLTTTTPQSTKTPKRQHATQDEALQHLRIEGVTLRVSPKNHERKHDEHERACGQCWEGYLSLQVEEKKNLSEIECMFCTSEISEGDFMTLAQKGTKYR